MKYRRKIFCLFLTFIMALSLFSAYVPAAEKNAATESYLQDGEYAVPLIAKVGHGSSDEGMTRDLFQTAYLAVDQGKYTVTLRKSNMTNQADYPNKCIKIAKENVKYDDLLSYDDLHNSDGFVKRETYDNENLWRDDIVFSDVGMGFGDVTFTVQDPTQNIVLAWFSLGTSTLRNEDGTKADVALAENISLCISQARRLAPLKTGTYSYVLEQGTYGSSEVQSGQCPVYDKADAWQKAYEVLSDKVEVTVDEDNKTASATFQLLGDAASKKKVKQQTKAQASTSKTLMMAYGGGKSAFTEVDVDDNACFTLKYDLSELKNLVFGPIIKFVSDSEDGWSGGVVVLTDKPQTEVTLTDEITGVKLTSTSYAISSADKLVVTEYMPDAQEDTEWPEVLVNLGNKTVDSFQMYRVSLEDQYGKEKVITRDATVSVPIPETYSDPVGYTVGISLNSGQDGEVEDGYMVFDYNVREPEYSGQNVFFIGGSMSKQSKATELNNGVYTVSWYLQSVGSGSASMSDGAFSKPATIVVYDDENGNKMVRLELNQTGATVGSMHGYLSRMSIAHIDSVDDDGTKHISNTVRKVIPSRYFRNEDGTDLQMDVWPAGKQVYAVCSAEKLYVEVPANETGYYNAHFRIPIMDGLTSNTSSVNEGYVGHSDKDAYLIIDYSTAQKVKDAEVTSDPVTDALNEAILAAGKLGWEQFTEESWSENQKAFAEALANARALQSDPNASLTEMEAARSALQDSMDTLTDHFIGGYKHDGDFASGLYTTSASLEAVDSATGLVQAETSVPEIAQASIYVNDDHTADLRISVPSDVTSFSVYSYYDQGYKQALGSEGTNASGNITYSYTMPAASGITDNLYESIPVSYTVNGSNDVQYAWLKTDVAGMKGETVSKKDLQNAIASAKTEAEKTTAYTTESLAALEAVIASSETLLNDEAATQNDIDAQVKALSNAVKALEKKSSSNPSDEPQKRKKTYSVPVTAVQASAPDQKSMMDGAIDGDAVVTVDTNGKSTYSLNFKGISIPTSTLYGHLLQLYIYQDGAGSAMTKADITKKQQDKGLDGTTTSEFPRTFTFTRDKSGESQIRVHVDVDAMKGFPQDAILVFDWDNKTETSDTPDPTPSDDSKKDDTKFAASKFTDVSKDAFYYDALNWAVEKGVTAGTTATTFSPNAPTTRAQMVQFLYKMAGSPAVSGTMPFTDVKEGSYYYNAVLWAVQNGITAGTTATTFSPNEKCSRAQMAQFLYKFKGKNAKVSGTMPFTDVAEGKYYYNAVLWAYQNKVTSGLNDTTYGPNADCTRGEMVQFLYNIKDL